MTFSVPAVNPVGQHVDLEFILAPPTAGKGGGFRCAYEVRPIGLSGDVLAANPLLAIRLAVFQIRVKLVHRFPEWQLRSANGEPLVLDYEESA